MVLSTDIDLLHPPADLEKEKHKTKRLVQSPNSFFMDVKCQGCFQITTVFSHSQSVVVCSSCSAVLCTPTGGKTRLTEVPDFLLPFFLFEHACVCNWEHIMDSGCSFRRKGD